MDYVFAFVAGFLCGAFVFWTWGEEPPAPPAPSARKGG